jgi:predicted nucleic acid-binding protein
MKYLVDANVLSEATRPSPKPSVVAWLRTHERELVIDPIVLGEIRLGILLVPRGKRRRQLEEWFEAGVGRMVCLPWEPAVGLRWAELLANLRSKGEIMPLKDSMIAATALLHGLTIATRNLRDFAKTGVELADPFRP